MEFRAYPDRALPHLQSLLALNSEPLAKVAAELKARLARGGSLLVFGSGHSAIFALELYHRAGGASFVVPVVDERLLPNAGPSRVRALERTPGAALPAFERVGPRAEDMLWVASQSGINSSGIDVALAARERGLFTVAFTSRAHSAAVQSRHPSGKRLFEVCDAVLDLGGERGDAVVEVAPGVRAGPLSSLGSILLGHTLLTAVCGELEREGRRCVYTSVNTPEGEERNQALEREASARDPALKSP